MHDLNSQHLRRRALALRKAVGAAVSDEVDSADSTRRQPQSGNDPARLLPTIDPCQQGWVDDSAFVADLRSAMASGAISVAYQPIVDLRTGRLHKVEALARWNDPRRGAIHPSEFIGLAERSGVIAELGETVLKQACADVLLMGAEGIDVELSVNLSVVQLRDPAVSRSIGQILSDMGFPPNRLWVEVTESVLVDDEAISPLQALHDTGVHLVIDDFGTGYGTFRYLTRLPIDELKIDMSFVSGLGIDPRDTAIVRSVVNLGRELGLEVVAEGVETESQRAQLLSLSCRLGQGWLFGRPVPFAECIAKYRHGTAPVQPGFPLSSVAREAVRVDALHACKILDTDPEAAFDALVQLSCQLLSTPMAAISFVDTDRQWFKASVGVDLTETLRGVSFSTHALAQPHEPFVIGDTERDPRFATNPLVTGSPNVRAYAGMPVRSREGWPIGVLSVLDTRTRNFTDVELGQLTVLSDQVAALIDLRRRAAELSDLHSRPIRPAVAADTGRLAVDLDANAVTIGGRQIHATRKECELLLFLVNRPGQVFSRAELLDQVWHSLPSGQNATTVTRHIHRLRGKIEDNPTRPLLLRTMRGRGYSFEASRSSSGVDVARTDLVEPRSGTWLDVDNRVVAVDDGMLALLAVVNRHDVVGRELSEFVAECSQAAPLTGLEMRASGYWPEPHRITLKAADGALISALVSIEAAEFNGKPAISGTAVEISAPGEPVAERLVVLDDLSDAVIVADSDLHILSWNPAAERLYGWSEQEVLGHTLHNVLRTADRQFDTAAWQAQRATGDRHAVVQQRTRDGSVLQVFSSINLVHDRNGAINRIVVVNRLASILGEAMDHNAGAALARMLMPTAIVDDIDPEADLLRLAASRALLRVEAVEEAVAICVALVHGLGGTAIPARLDDGRALAIDLSFGHGEPIVPIADSPLARFRLERILPEVLEEARQAIGRIRQREQVAGQTQTRPGPGADLTARELEILSLMASGLAHKQIARRLDLRLNTVRNHAQNVLRKLQAHSRMEAVATAMNKGIISHP